MVEFRKSLLIGFTLTVDHYGLTERKVIISTAFGGPNHNLYTVSIQAKTVPR